MEKIGGLGIYIPRRHFSGGKIKRLGAKTFKHPPQGFRGFWYACQPRKVKFGSNPTNKSLGFSHKFFGRKIRGTKRKTYICKKRVGKTHHTQENFSKENGSNSGGGERISDSPTFFKGLYRPNGTIHLLGKKLWVGHPHGHSLGLEKSDQGHKEHFTQLEGKTNGRKNSGQKFAFRCLQPRLGGIGHKLRSRPPGILEGKFHLAHQFKRIACSHFNSKESCKTGGKSTPLCGQYSNLELFKKIWRQKRPFQCHSETLFGLVSRQQNSIGSAAGPQLRNVGRPPQQMVQGPRGLHPKQKYFSKMSAFNGQSGKTPDRYVCKSWKSSVGKICGPVAPLPSLGLQCPRDGPKSSGGLLCQPPLDNNFTMVGKTKKIPQSQMSNNGTPLGWSSVVAPTSKALGPQNTGHSHTSPLGIIHKLPGPENETYQMAPTLCAAIRFLLERKQVSAESITSHLTKVEKLASYDKAFRTFWAFCHSQKINLLEAPMEEVALQLQKMGNIDKIKAKYAYSAVVLLPGYDFLKFSPLLKNCKRDWFSSQPKYATFWDAQPVLKKLIRQKINWKNESQVRDRLILVLRLLQLCRSIDLSRMWRTMSQVGNEFYIKIQRKGALRPTWEQLLELPSGQSDICPVALALAYVDLTKRHCPDGSLLFRSVTSPYAPLSANSIGRITRNLLHGLGVPPLLATTLHQGGRGKNV